MKMEVSVEDVVRVFSRAETYGLPGVGHERTGYEVSGSFELVIVGEYVNESLEIGVSQFLLKPELVIAFF